MNQYTANDVLVYDYIHMNQVHYEIRFKISVTRRFIHASCII